MAMTALVHSLAAPFTGVLAARLSRLDALSGLRRVAAGGGGPIVQRCGHWVPSQMCGKAGAKQGKAHAKGHSIGRNQPFTGNVEGSKEASGGEAATIVIWGQL